MLKFKRREEMNCNFKRTELSDCGIAPFFFSKFVSGIFFIYLNSYWISNVKTIPRQTNFIQ